VLGWPNRSGGSLQSCSIWVQLPSPAPFFRWDGFCFVCSCVGLLCTTSSCWLGFVLLGVFAVCLVVCFGCGGCYRFCCGWGWFCFACFGGRDECGGGRVCRCFKVQLVVSLLERFNSPVSQHPTASICLLGTETAVCHWQMAASVEQDWGKDNFLRGESAY
jgi:hypothetical protein